MSITAASFNVDKNWIQSNSPTAGKYMCKLWRIHLKQHYTLLKMLAKVIVWGNGYAIILREKARHKRVQKQHCYNCLKKYCVHKRNKKKHIKNLLVYISVMRLWVNFFFLSFLLFPVFWLIFNGLFSHCNS